MHYPHQLKFSSCTTVSQIKPRSKNTKPFVNPLNDMLNSGEDIESIFMKSSFPFFDENEFEQESFLTNFDVQSDKPMSAADDLSCLFDFIETSNTILNVQNDKPMSADDNLSCLFDFIETSNTIQLPKGPEKKTYKRKPCLEVGCTNLSRSHSLCKAHGGGRRCSVNDCSRAAQSSPIPGQNLCIAHGGGYRCTHPYCNKAAQRKGLCKSHGGKSPGQHLNFAQPSPANNVIS